MHKGYFEISFLFDNLTCQEVKRHLELSSEGEFNVHPEIIFHKSLVKNQCWTNSNCEGLLKIITIN